MDAVMQVLGGVLRLALLLLGGLLVLGIILWEWLQRRRARRADEAHRAGPLGQSREPTADASSAALEDPLFATRPQPSRRGEERREPTLGHAEVPIRERVPDPPLVDLEAARSLDTLASTIPVVEPVPPALIEPAPVVESVTVDDATPRVEWPPEEQRVIVSLRVVARNGERFTGASLRQSLLGEGFVHGEMEIFHRPHGDGRVILSAASLTRPGSFDLTTMDSGLFLGLNLFAVLPGPLAGKDTVDKLLTVGHTLARRLRGELLDGRGEALSESRLADMRREAAAADPR
ncbi:MAG: cell division protein ZipA C-terminal FtsZ-binding domain-containing protein [Nevskiaceae bacterium]